MPKSRFIFPKKIAEHAVGLRGYCRPYAWHHALRQDLERSSHAGAVLQGLEEKHVHRHQAHPQFAPLAGLDE